MSVSIDFDAARAILGKALDASKSGESVASDVEPGLRKSLETVVFGTHKTYKYILVTNLLAKATCPKANSLCLQAGARMRGAFDSRRLCHKVVVPFERERLANALGASNEPYLNKPARFPKLDARNAVRDGNDRHILETLIRIAESVNEGGHALAFVCLAFCFRLLEKVIANNALLQTVSTIMTPDLVDIYAFVTRYVAESFEGETCAAVVGAVEKQFYASLRGNYRVVVHKVNESGASSKEIGDIDVYEDDTCFHSIEVKDKAFTVYDVEHAFNKMIAAHVRRGSFVYGPRATFDEEKVKITLYSFEERKFVTLFMGVLPYVRLVLFQTPHVATNGFLQLLLDTALEINAKEETIRRIHDIAAEMFGARGERPQRQT